MARVELLSTVDKLISDADLLSPYLSPVVGASVLVKNRATGNPVTIYAAETGGTTVTNPLVTDANGRVNGWVDEGSLVLTISGSGITTYNQPYEAARADQIVAIDGTRVTSNTMPGTSIADASIPNTKLATGAVTNVHLAASALPLGTIVANWVPSKPGGGYLVPTGWAICNGQTLTAGQHSFPGGGSVTLPDLRDALPRGTDETLTYGGAAGMNAVIGANTLDLSHVHDMGHTHTIPTHSHGLQDHTHTIAHTHTVTVPDHVHGLSYQKGHTSGTIDTSITNTNVTYGSGAFAASVSGSSVSSSGGASALSTASQSGGTSTNAFAGNTASAGSAATNIRSRSIGVIYLIRVKNT